MPNPADLLAAVPLFAQASPAALAALAACCRDRSLREKEVLFRRGEPGSTLLVIVAGEIRVTRVGAAGKEQVLRIMRRGDVFGEIAVLDGRARTADAVAETNATLLELERRDVARIMQTDHGLTLGAIALLCDRLRSTDQRLEALLFHDTAARLATTLLALAGERAGGRIDLTQQALGDMAGATRETTNKKLREWQAAGVLALEPGRVRVLDTAALRAVIPD